MSIVSIISVEGATMMDRTGVVTATTADFAIEFGEPQPQCTDLTDIKDGCSIFGDTVTFHPSQGNFEAVIEHCRKHGFVVTPVSLADPPTGTIYDHRGKQVPASSAAHLKKQLDILMAKWESAAKKEVAKRAAGIAKMEAIVGVKFNSKAAAMRDWLRLAELIDGGALKEQTATDNAEVHAALVALGVKPPVMKMTTRSTTAAAAMTTTSGAAAAASAPPPAPTTTKTPAANDFGGFAFENVSGEESDEPEEPQQKAPRVDLPMAAVADVVRRTMREERLRQDAKAPRVVHQALRLEDGTFQVNATACGPEADIDEEMFAGDDSMTALHPDNLAEDDRHRAADIDRFFAEYAKNAGTRGDAIKPQFRLMMANFAADKRRGELTTKNRHKYVSCIMFLGATATDLAVQGHENAKQADAAWKETLAKIVDVDKRWKPAKVLMAVRSAIAAAQKSTRGVRAYRGKNRGDNYHSNSGQSTTSVKQEPTQESGGRGGFRGGRGRGNYRGRGQ